MYLINMQEIKIFLKPAIFQRAEVLMQDTQEDMKALNMHADL